MTLRNILFVDDDSNVINGINRMLRRQSDQWNLFFVNSGDAALKLMQQTPIDLIVTDMMMPGMRGDELLKKVAEHYPATVRVILSGYADEESLKNALIVAHQYLSKPCSPELLKETISQVFKIQSCIHNPYIIQSIGDINQLPSLPRIYQELKKEIDAVNSTAQSISKIFARDMALSAKLLQLVNSPYFGLNRKISNLNEAVNMIGIKKLMHLVLNAFVNDSFKVTNRKFLVYLDYLSLDSMRTAELARQIALAQNQQGDRPDQAYLGGLLHNMGLLICMCKLPDKFAVLIEQVKQTEVNVFELEKQIFGFTRAEAGAYVLGLWKIPPRIIEAILLQNNPDETDYDDVNALTAVHAAAALLKPPATQEAGRLFDITLSRPYLERLGKLEDLTHWEQLAEKLTQKYSDSK